MHARTHTHGYMAVPSPCGKVETHAAVAVAVVAAAELVAEKGGHMSGNGGHPSRVGVPVGMYAPLSLSDTFFAPRRIFLAWRLPAYARMTRRFP